MNSIPLLGTLTGIGATIGTALGYAVAGPAAMPIAAKAGAAMGFQTGLACKSENALDALANRTGGVIEKVGDVACVAMVNIADVWSKMALTGYAISIGLSGVQQSSLNYSRVCDSMIQSVQCFSLGMTDLSLNTLVAGSTIMLGYQVWKMGRK